MSLTVKEAFQLGRVASDAFSVYLARKEDEQEITDLLDLDGKVDYRFEQLNNHQDFLILRMSTSKNIRQVPKVEAKPSTDLYPGMYPERWEVGMRVRYVQNMDHGPSRGQTGVVVKISEECKTRRGDAYQVFWTRPDSSETSMFWTTPMDVILESYKE